MLSVNWVVRRHPNEEEARQRFRIVSSHPSGNIG